MPILDDISRDLIWNVPNDKGETVERYLIRAGNWRLAEMGIIVSKTDGIYSALGKSWTNLIIPFEEVEYATGENRRVELPLSKPVDMDFLDEPFIARS